ncbi:MAG: hypothetical protein NUV64_00320 [Parcubacteria group bacterium]|nr:hypothetical protein [Parcubacteria group bacterium]MCR4342490.1 hypothetical protein [Patescibacteria group bacterium]
MMQNYKESVKFKKGVMRRIYAIWLLRNTFNLRTGLLLFFAWQMTLYISFGDVFGNSPSFFDIPSMYSFMLSAFLHTEIIVKLFFVLISVLAFLFFKDWIKGVLNFVIPIRIRGRVN